MMMQSEIPTDQATAAGYMRSESMTPSCFSAFSAAKASALVVSCFSSWTWRSMSPFSTCSMISFSLLVLPCAGAAACVPLLRTDMLS